MNRKLKFIINLILIVIVLATIVFICCLDKLFTPKATVNLSASEIEKDFNTVIIDDEQYIMKDNYNYLIMVVDDFGIIENNLASKVSYMTLVTFNTNDEIFFTFNIDPSTKANINVLNSNGEVVDTKEAQIGEAYKYSDGKYESSYNVKNAVKDYLYGLKIDEFICINKSSVKSIMEFLENIEIENDENLTSVNSSWTKGSIISLDDMNLYTYINSPLDSNKIFSYKKDIVFNAILDRLLDFSIEELYGIYTLINDNMVTNADYYSLRKLARVFRNYNHIAGPTIDYTINENLIETNIDALKEAVKEFYYDKREDN